MDHAVGTGHLPAQILNDRERNLDPEFLLDVAQPGNMAVILLQEDLTVSATAIEKLSESLGSVADEIKGVRVMPPLVAVAASASA